MAVKTGRTAIVINPDKGRSSRTALRGRKRSSCSEVSVPSRLVSAHGSTSDSDLRLASCWEYVAPFCLSLLFPARNVHTSVAHPSLNIHKYPQFLPPFKYVQLFPWTISMSRCSGLNPANVKLALGGSDGCIRARSAVFSWRCQLVSEPDCVGEPISVPASLLSFGPARPATECLFGLSCLSL